MTPAMACLFTVAAQRWNFTKLSRPSCCSHVPRYLTLSALSGNTGEGECLWKLLFFEQRFVEE
jgi:hypothetical protein